MRFRARKDVAHKPIVDGARKHGLVCFDSSQLGGGFPDVVCYYPPTDTWKVAEIKSDNKISKQKKSTGQLKPDQVKVNTLAPIPVVRSVRELMTLFGVEVSE